MEIHCKKDPKKKMGRKTNHSHKEPILPNNLTTHRKIITPFNLLSISYIDCMVKTPNFVKFLPKPIFIIWVFFN